MTIVARSSFRSNRLVKETFENFQVGNASLKL
ncbi:hypothetical protein AAZX31_06G201300 [Glycine max]